MNNNLKISDGIDTSIWKSPKYEEMILSGASLDAVGFIKHLRTRFIKKPLSIKKTKEFIHPIIYKAHNNILEYMNEITKENNCFKTLDSKEMQKHYDNIMDILNIGKKTTKIETEEQKINYMFVAPIVRHAFTMTIKSLHDFNKFGNKIINNYNSKYKWTLKTIDINNKKVFFYENINDKKHYFYGDKNKYTNELPKDNDFFFQTEEDAKNAFDLFLNTRALMKAAPKKTNESLRTGDSYIKNNVTEDVLINTFGLRNVTFGKSISKREIQDILNITYNSLCDIAKVLKIPNNKIGLGGNLDLDFGSLGGDAKLANAHFSIYKCKKVISLKRFKGAGSLAHEYGHALDNYLSEKFFNKNNYFSECMISNKNIQEINGKHRTEYDFFLSLRKNKKNKSMSNKEWNDLVISNGVVQKNDIISDEKILIPILNKTRELFHNLYTDNEYSINSSINGKQKYYLSIVEMFARSFETYIYDSLKKDNIHNYFLVGSDRDENSDRKFYPYPKGEERININNGFDIFFDKVLKNERKIENKLKLDI